MSESKSRNHPTATEILARYADHPDDMGKPLLSDEDKQSLRASMALAEASERGYRRLLNDIDDPLVYAVSHPHDPDSWGTVADCPDCGKRHILELGCYIEDVQRYAATHRQRPWYPAAPTSRVSPIAWTVVAMIALSLFALFVAAASR